MQCPNACLLGHEPASDCQGPKVIGTNFQERRLSFFIARKILGMPSSSLTETYYYDCPANPVHIKVQTDSLSVN